MASTAPDPTLKLNLDEAQEGVVSHGSGPLLPVSSREQLAYLIDLYGGELLDHASSFFS